MKIVKDRGKVVPRKGPSRVTWETTLIVVAWGGLILALRLRDVLEYALGYARSGYPVVPGISDAIAQAEALFREEWPESARVYLAQGVPGPTTTFRNPELAQTYERIRILGNIGKENL